MNPPFSAEAFFEVFSAYNAAVWPMQAALLGLAMTILVFALKATKARGRAISAALALLWFWIAVAYHWVFFSQINPAARLFAGLFAIQAVLLLWFGFRSKGMTFNPSNDAFGWAGGLLVAYALVAYPVIGLATGLRYPSVPTFGVPCPTTIFTVGVLLWARPRPHGALLVIPAVWAVIALSAALSFGVIADFMLPVSVVIAVGLELWQKRRIGAVKARIRREIRIGDSRSAHV